MSDKYENLFYVGLAVMLLVCAGCETSSDTPSGMSSGSVSVSLDFSGSYIGTYSGSRVVESKTQPNGDRCTTNYTIISEVIETNGTNIVIIRTNSTINCTTGSDLDANFTKLVLSQSDSGASLTDNNGSSYQGSVGDYIYDDPSGNIREGDTIVQAQLSFSGFDQGSQLMVDFAGTLKAVALQDISGTTSINSDNGSDSSNSTISANHDFTLTAQNAQYIMEGSWQEHGGRSSSARAVAPASGGSISMQSTFEQNQNTDTNSNVSSHL